MNEKIEKGSNNMNAPSLLMYFSVLAGVLGALNLGLVMGYSSPAIVDLVKEREQALMENKTFILRNEKDRSWIASAGAAGAMFGVPFSSMLGRKATLILNCVPFILGWSLISLAHATWMIICGRFVTGIAAGLASGVVSIYAMEISPIYMRGAVMANGGSTLAATMGIFLNWRWLAMACCIPSVIMPFMMIFAPESPVYMMSKYGYSKKTITTLKKLRREHGDVLTNELNEIASQAQNKAPLIVSKEQLKESIACKPLLVLMALFVFQQLAGITAVGFYQTSIFVESNIRMNSHICNALVTLAPLSVVIISSFVIDKSGRKLLLYLSGMGTISSLILLSFYFWYKSTPSFTQNYGWVSIIALILYQGSVALGFNSIPWILVAEMTPYFARSFISSICTFTVWSLAFLTTKFFDDLKDSLTPQRAYLFFAMTTCFGVLFVKFFVPETKMKTIDEILSYFTRKANLTDRKKTIMTCNTEV
ncbi:solute carrier family 2: facilitated glucose transporter member 8-like protein [Dinothrombium tinctorium]|uniref:Solute carrier family 2: facilitated glucose transporter member 8-like protein n=1 Tax=Dinothrombium tinctorium TaxID=1965070 RepID=A0A3S3NMM4_9ACAR|nr:solute carrier family 2: facilitated glucose transporter member 8-like protein [Dinothrombium tinctorium]